MTSDAPLHVYGLVEASAPMIRKLEGRQGAPVRRIKLGKVDALVSELDPSTRLKRDDLLAHAHVLERVADRESVLPMRFGVQVAGEEDLRRRLQGDADWAALLHRFHGLVQVTIDAAHDEEPALREVLRLHPELVALREPTADSEAADHARKLELGEGIARALEEMRSADGAALLERLTPHASAVADQTEPGRLLLAAFLVERRKRHAFDAAVDAARKALPLVDIRYVGPQPPWAFMEETPGTEA